MENLIDPNASKEVAMTSLDWCVRSCQLSLLKAVLSAHFSHGAISDLERECALVLHHAVTSGCRDALTSLLRHVDDAFLQQRDAEGSGDVREGRTRLEKLLGLAVECGHRDVTEILLNKGASPNASYRGKPLLHLSLSLRHQAVASLLLDRGADVNMIDSKGETPLFVAVSSDDKEMTAVIEKLLQRGADVNHRSLTGRQPIHNAALTSNSDTLTRLAQAGCDVSAKDDVMGDTPLHLACSRCNQAAVMTLIHHGAELNSLNAHRHTPLRKLLQHTTRVSRDFHHHSRMTLARVLVKLGFQLDPLTSEATRCQEDLPFNHHTDNPSFHQNAHDLSFDRNAGRNISSNRNTHKTLSSHQTQPYENSSSFLSESLNITRFQSNKESENTNLNLKKYSNDANASSKKASNRVRSGSKSSGSRSCGRDKVFETFQSLVSERKKGVAGLQHLCRLQLRQQLPKVLFQESVQKLEVSSALQQYLMFLPRMVDETLGW